MWKKQNTIAATLSPILGLASSLIAWLVTAQKESGNLSVASTGAKYVKCSPFYQCHLAPSIPDGCLHTNSLTSQQSNARR